MNKAKKSLLLFVLVSISIVVILYGALIYSQNKTDAIFYYGLNCPHCKVVEAFMTENNVSEKMRIEEKEVSSNQKNAQELIKIGNLCKLEDEIIGGVPLLYFNKTCYVGDKDVIALINNTLHNGGFY